MLKYHSLLKRLLLTMEVKHLPNIKSAKRRVKVEAKATLRNRIVKTELKTLAKKFSGAVER